MFIQTDTGFFGRGKNILDVLHRSRQVLSGVDLILFRLCQAFGYDTQSSQGTLQELSRAISVDTACLWAERARLCPDRHAIHPAHERSF